MTNSFSCSPPIDTSLTSSFYPYEFSSLDAFKSPIHCRGEHATELSSEGVAEADLDGGAGDDVATVLH